jgi:hypothetical protein
MWLGDSHTGDRVIHTGERMMSNPEYVLIDYHTGLSIRVATEAEYLESVAAAEDDGGAGVIEVDGVLCYVVDWCELYMGADE